MKFIKGRVRNILALFILVPIAVILSVLSILQLIFSYVFQNGSRGWKIIIGYDQIGNIILGGHEDETFSARCYRDQSEKYMLIEKRVDKLFKIISNEDRHCYNAFIQEIEYCQKYVKENSYLKNLEVKEFRS